MATFVISYDLNKPGQDYSSLFEAIKNLGNWWHCLDSTWVVVSNLNASQIRDALKARMDASDALLVVQSANIGAWHGFKDNCASWLKNNL
ncbi:SinR [Sulfurifustis variabilis]|uniref:SinR n=1 Tax=Sulfurifustis variabilis TaxID=1675686 RepID=A0A1B4V1K2_9GAMM|nr:SinR [Sulfurifustis variabilis]